MIAFRFFILNFVVHLFFFFLNFGLISLPYDSIEVHVNTYNLSPLDPTVITRKVLDQTKDIKKHMNYNAETRVCYFIRT
jgi:hypothetical protein